MKDNGKFIEVKDSKELSVKDAHLAVISSLPADFKRVDFDNPRSIMEYGHDDKQAISDILINTAGFSIKQGRNLLTDEMVKKIYSFDEELDASDKFANRKELPIIARAKKALTRLGVKKFEKEEEQNSYGARYEAYCKNIEEVCNYMEASMQESLNDIELRKQIAWEMKPYLEHLQMTIKAGEADYFLLLEEIEELKKKATSTEDSFEKEDLENEIKMKEQLAFVFNDKLDKLRKVFTSYKQQLLVYAEQQHNEMILVTQQQSYIEDQQPILRAQGSSMIFNREQQARANDLDRLNEATNKAYQENAKAIIQNTETIADLAVNGGLKVESIETLHKAIEHGIEVIRETQQKLTDRIAADEAVLRDVNAAGEEFEKDLEGINETIEGLTPKSHHKVLRKTYGTNKQ